MNGAAREKKPHAESAAKSSKHNKAPAVFEQLLDDDLAPLFWIPQRLGKENGWFWQGHVPFAHWLVSTTRPRLLVELGTHNGISYSAFCEANLRVGASSRCFAVDTWGGDKHTGRYSEEIYADLKRFNEQRYGKFSSLLRMTFDEALREFEDGTIDLLHIDGLHTYDAVRHDFENWLPKLSSRAVVLFHDTNERRGDFGVWRLWAELRERYPSFEFLHSHGLGVLCVGQEAPAPVLELCALERPNEIAAIRERFEHLGQRWYVEDRLTHVSGLAEQGRIEAQRLASVVGAKEAEIGAKEAEIGAKEAEIGAKEVEIGAKEAEIGAKEAEIGALTRSLAGARDQIGRHDQAIAEAKLQLATNDQKISTLSRELAKAEGEKNRLRSDLDALYQSTSWRISAPVRAVKNGMRAFTRLPSAGRSFLSRRAYVAWHGLPISIGSKQKFKNATFRALPFLFKGTTAYRAWQDFHEVVASPPTQAAKVSSVPQKMDYVPRFDVPPQGDKPAQVIAFYLPQFHRVPENDAFWGEGFTEWTNVRSGQPQFEGHYQPHVPDELEYYDLLDPQAQRRQVELAKLYGLGGFCFYFYWFNGQRPLEKPVENYLKDNGLDLPFCLCWANENWTRTWDGRESEILLAQKHSIEDDIAFIEHVSKYLRDPRYIRIDGRPLLLVYRPNILPSAKETAQRWREWCRNNGIGEIYLAYTQSFERVDPTIYDFDAAVEFPPNMEAKSSELPNLRANVKTLRNDFSCSVLDWRALVERSRDYRAPGYKLFRAVCPSWDNTARRKHLSRILLNSSPVGYHEWLTNAIEETSDRLQNPDERLVFVNAWNEWGEGAHLEPDARYGYAYLEATRLAVAGAVYLPTLKRGSAWISGYRPGQLRFAEEKPVVLLCTHSGGEHVFGGERSFLDVLDAMRTIDVNVICCVPRNNNAEYINAIEQRSVGVYSIPYQQWSSSPEDEAVIETFVKVIRRHGVSLLYANTIMLREPLVAARRCGIETIVHAREIITQDPTMAGQIGLPPDEIISQVLARTDHIIANSETTGRCFERAISLSVVPNAVDVDGLDLPNTVDNAEIRFAMVSSNLRKKGLYDLVELAGRCETVVPNARFLIIGPENSDIVSLRDKQRKGKLPRNISFPGYRATPREAMAEANVILSLSHFAESFGRTVAEAMAARRPVIAYDWGAIPELVHHGETGFLVGYRNLDELTARVKEICESPELISQMGQQGRALASDLYSKSALRERLKHVLGDILQDNQSWPGTGKRGRDTDKLPSPNVTVIIPVYNAPDETKRCIESISSWTDFSKARILVIDDRSSDPRISSLLSECETLGGFTVLRNDQNLGYTKTINRGVQWAGNDDVVLLNSDTIVTPGWLDGLRSVAYRSPDTGTVTAMGDNAGAFSFPEPNQPNPKPDDVTHEEWARAILQRTVACEPVEVPTGSGFCMYVRRDLIHKIGIFDEEAFPRGYGEENDFCMRALRAGWRNLISPRSYVFHVRTASFGKEKEQLVEAGVDRVTKRYPDYAAKVKTAFGSPEINALRRAAKQATRDTESLHHNALPTKSSPGTFITEPLTGKTSMSATAPITWVSQTDFKLDGLSFTCDATTHLNRPTNEERIIVAKSRSLIDDLYEHLSPMAPRTMLEIGIAQGGSAFLHTSLFGLSKYVGLDLRNEDAQVQRLLEKTYGADRVKLYYQTSQADKERIAHIFGNEFGGLCDVVIDDGSHQYEPSLQSFEVALPHVRPGGLYIIEDWGWAHWPGAKWQDPTKGYNRDKLALSNLIFELTMLCASRPDILSEGIIKKGFVAFRRGHADIDWRKFKLSTSYLTQGRAFHRL